MADGVVVPARTFSRASRALDIGLTIAIVVLLLAALAFVAFFGYTVYQDRRAAEEANPAMRVANALKEQVRKSPNDVILRVRLGEAFAAARRFPDAIEQLNEALKLDPKHTGAYLDLGLVAAMNKQPARAENYFKKVVELTEGQQFSGVDNRRENAMFNLGRLALESRRYEEAVGYFKGALRIRKSAADTYYLLAQSFEGLREYDEALKNLDIAKQFDKKFAEAWYLAGQIYMKQDDKVNASYQFRQAATIAPDAEQPQEALAGFGPASDWIARAEVALKAGDVEQALEDALIAANLEPENVDALKQHGKVLVVRGDLKGALQVYRNAAKLDQKDAQLKAEIKKLEAQLKTNRPAAPARTTTTSP